MSRSNSWGIMRACITAWSNHASPDSTPWPVPRRNNRCNMNKTLAWTAVLSLAVAVICLSLANSIAGNEWRSGRWWNLASSCRISGDGTKPGSVTLAWEPVSSEFQIALPATVTIGPARRRRPSSAVIPRLFSMCACPAICSIRRRFRLRRPAGQRPAYRSGGPQLAVEWQRQAELSALAQEALDLRISGSGDVRASGSVQDLSLRISGSGSGDFAKLAAKTASVQISGSGNADIAPQPGRHPRVGQRQCPGSWQPEDQIRMSADSGRVETVP